MRLYLALMLIFSSIFSGCAEKVISSSKVMEVEDIKDANTSEVKTLTRSQKLILRREKRFAAIDKRLDFLLGIDEDVEDEEVEF